MSGGNVAVATRPIITTVTEKTVDTQTMRVSYPKCAKACTRKEGFFT